MDEIKNTYNKDRSNTDTIHRTTTTMKYISLLPWITIAFQLTSIASGFSTNKVVRTLSIRRGRTEREGNNKAGRVTKLFAEELPRDVKDAVSRCR